MPINILRKKSAGIEGDNSESIAAEIARRLKERGSKSLGRRFGEGAMDVLSAAASGIRASKDEQIPEAAFVLGAGAGAETLGRRKSLRKFFEQPEVASRADAGLLEVSATEKPTETFKALNDYDLEVIKTAIGAKRDRKDPSLEVVKYYTNSKMAGSDLGKMREELSGKIPPQIKLAAANLGTPTATFLESLNKNITDIIIRERSGAAITEKEREQLEALMPKPNDTGAIIQQKLDRIEKFFFVRANVIERYYPEMKTFYEEGLQSFDASKTKKEKPVKSGEEPKKKQTIALPGGESFDLEE